MIINEQTLDLVFKGFQTVYTDANIAAPIHWDKIAMKVTSSARDESYGWLGKVPNMRQWIGPRVIHSLEAYGFTIANVQFESTLSVKRTDIADDRLGVFKPAFSEMGRLAATHPEELIMGLLSGGFDAACFDGQSFFDADHPITDAQGAETTASNMQAGSEDAWYLLDTSREVKPLIWQEREPYAFQSMVEPTNPHVFMTDEFIYGVKARANAGYGLWQLAFGSKAALDVSNYAAARAAMMSYTADGGRKLGITPTTLVVPPSLEEKALQILNATHDASGASNVWAGTAELIVTPFVG